MDAITIEERLAALERWAIGHGYKLPVPPAPVAPMATTSSSAALTPAIMAVPGPRDAAVPVASSVTPPVTVAVPTAIPAEPPHLAPLPKRPSAPPPVPKPSRPPIDIERLLSGRGLAWIGGLAILIGVVFFLGLAISRGWIGPTARVLIGAGAGLACMGGGAALLERRERMVGHVLVAVGLGVINLTLVAATRLYGLIDPAVGLMLALVLDGLATALALRSRSQAIAAFGLATALAAPLLLGAAPGLATLGLVGLALVATVPLALTAAWPWLPPLALVLTAPQLLVWLDGKPAVGSESVVPWTVLAIFWLLHAIASGGDAWRGLLHPVSGQAGKKWVARLRPTDAMLLLASDGVVLVGGLLSLGPVHSNGLDATLVALLGLAHLALATPFLRAGGDRHPFGLVAAGAGIATLAMAATIAFDGPAVAVIWGAQAVALAWIAQRRTHPQAAWGAGVLGTLATLHLLTIEYGTDWVQRTTPFVNSAGATLAYLLIAAVVTGVLVPRPSVQRGLATASLLVMIRILPLELNGLVLEAAWAAVALLALVFERLLPAGPRTPTAPPRVALAITAILAYVLTAQQALVLGLGLGPGWYNNPAAFDGVVLSLPTRPFFDVATAAALILVAAALLGGWLQGSVVARRAGAIAAVYIAALLLPRELAIAATTAGWALLAIVLLAIPERDRTATSVWLGAATPLIVVALIALLTVVAPLPRLAVDLPREGFELPIFNMTMAAIACEIGVLLMAWRWTRSTDTARLLATGAAILTVYLLSIGLVDIIGWGVTLETLASRAKAGQVAVSLLWAALGGCAFAAGIARRVRNWRIFGLSLLAVATVKVFLYDLAALDAVYKVASFIGLGILLLASSYLYQRHMPADPPPGPADGEPPVLAGVQPEIPTPPAA